MSFSQSFEQFIPREERTWNRLAVSLGMFILGTIFASWASRIPDIKHFLNLSDAQLGFALFAAPIGQIPSMLVTPMLVKRFGSCSIVTTAMLCYPIMLVSLGFVQSVHQLFLGSSALAFSIAC